MVAWLCVKSSTRTPAVVFHHDTGATSTALQPARFDALPELDVSMIGSYVKFGRDGSPSRGGRGSLTRTLKSMTSAWPPPTSETPLTTSSLASSRAVTVS